MNTNTEQERANDVALANTIGGEDNTSNGAGVVKDEKTRGRGVGPKGKTPKRGETRVQEEVGEDN